VIDGRKPTCYFHNQVFVVKERRGGERQEHNQNGVCSLLGVEKVIWKTQKGEKPQQKEQSLLLGVKYIHHHHRRQAAVHSESVASSGSGGTHARASSCATQQRCAHPLLQRQHNS
jgi:hypothetical protein